MGPDGLQRIPSALPVQAMKTFRALTPMRPATCAEYQCDAWLHGWVTVVPADSPAADYIRQASSRVFTERRSEGGLAEFTFEPGQQGFAGDEHNHRMPSGRPERLIVADGDWRGNPTGRVREHVRADDWIDDMAGTLDRVKTQAERG